MKHSTEDSFGIEDSESNIEQFADYFIDAKNIKLLKDIQGKKVLDVGCGMGRLSIFLSERNFEVTGLDINKSFIDLANDKAKNKKLNVNFIHGHIDQLEEKYDTIVIADVLEHIIDDASFIADLKRLLKKDGQLVLMVPAFEFLRSPRDDAVGHIRRYTKDELRRKFSDQGYEIVRLDYWKFINIFNCILNKMFRQKEHTYAFFSPLNKFLRFWFLNVENKFIFPLGETMLLVARLK